MFWHVQCIRVSGTMEYIYCVIACVVFHMFQTRSLEDVRCVFWNFTTRYCHTTLLCGMFVIIVTVYRDWSSDGVSTMRVNGSDVDLVRCISTHLTSFAVLVDASSGGKNVGGIDHYCLLHVVTMICTFIIMTLGW